MAAISGQWKRFPFYCCPLSSPIISPRVDCKFVRICVSRGYWEDRSRAFCSEYRSDYRMSRSQRLLRFRANVVSWACGAAIQGATVYVPGETMTHGYTVNWGDSLTLCIGTDYRRRRSRRETAMWGTDLGRQYGRFSPSQFPRERARLPPGKQRRLLLPTIIRG